jgi:hypothetical protein
MVRRHHENGPPCTPPRLYNNRSHRGTGRACRTAGDGKLNPDKPAKHGEQFVEAGVANGTGHQGFRGAAKVVLFRRGDWLPPLLSAHLALMYDDAEIRCHYPNEIDLDPREPVIIAMMVSGTVNLLNAASLRMT